MAIRSRDETAFPEMYAITLTEPQALYLFTKMKYWYKLPHRIEFRGTRDSGNCSKNRVRVSHNPSLGVLVHEVSHAIQFQQRRGRYDVNKERWHSKAQLSIMRRVGKPTMALYKTTFG